MDVIGLIAAKRDGRELSNKDISAIIQKIVSGEIPDYQVSAWLMAVYINGMTFGEIEALTHAMRDSGNRIDMSSLPEGISIDKHSTGGVGDKTSLVVAPLLAAAGVPILKMSGRGLGFSGGTIDKLESIPGFRVELTPEEALEQTRSIGLAILAQSAQLAPADKILYSLRDVTGTVDSIPLIASSIMCKKLAGGASRILLDVKVGRGAFMHTLKRARELAKILIKIGNRAGTPTLALLTDMDTPLGRSVGNALEVKEAIMLLNNDPQSDSRFRSLCLSLTAHGLVAAGKCSTLQSGRSLAQRLLSSGSGSAKFVEWIEAQGGPPGMINILSSLPVSFQTFQVYSPVSGYLNDIDPGLVGELAVNMGAGRAVKGQSIDHSTGIYMHLVIGDSVIREQPLATLFLSARDSARTEEFAAAYLSACQISSIPQQHRRRPVFSALK